MAAFGYRFEKEQLHKAGSHTQKASLAFSLTTYVPSCSRIVLFTAQLDTFPSTHPFELHCPHLSCHLFDQFILRLVKTHHTHTSSLPLQGTASLPPWPLLQQTREYVDPYDYRSEMYTNTVLVDERICKPTEEPSSVHHRTSIRI